MSLTPSTGSRGRMERWGETGGAFGRGQLARLFKLVLMLQSERFPNARELAGSCEVSRRTIYRDLELLAEAGIPVRYRVERQGYQVGRGFFLPPTNLGETETLALLVAARQWKGGDGLGLLHQAWGGAVKLVQGLNPEIRERVLAASELFEDGLVVESGAGDRQELQGVILSSLTQLRQMRVWYREVGMLEERCTKFSLYRLLLHDKRWFMAGRSTLHRRVEVIGLPWVRKVVLTDDRYAIPPRFSLERYLAKAWRVRREPARYRVWLRFSALVAPELNDRQWHASERRVAREDGGIDLHLVLDGIDEVVRWILGFGSEVEVIAPRELRQALFRVASQVARQHRPRLTSKVETPGPC